MSFKEYEDSNLLQEIERLKAENASLKLKLDRLESVNESELAAFEFENEILVDLNRLALELAYQPYYEIFPFIVSSFKKIFGVRAAWLTIYNEATSELEVKYTSLSDDENASIIKMIGENISQKPIYLSKEDYHRLRRETFSRINSIKELTFGAVPDWIGIPVQKFFNIGWFAGLALVHGDKLVGTMVLAGSEDQPFPEKEKVLVFAGVAAIAIERKKAEESLHESERKFRELSELLPQTIFEMDLLGRLTFVNKSAHSFFGYDSFEFANGLNALQMIVPEDRERAKINISKVFSKKDTSFNEYTAIRKDGSTFPVIIFSSAVYNNEKAVGVRGIIVDITERKALEEQIKSSLKEKEILLKEVHHRVKNNLQVIMSLFNLQSDLIENPEVLSVFSESRNRIKSMALIHELLYKENTFNSINFKNYVKNLVAFFKGSYFEQNANVNIEVDVENLNLDIDRIIPCGLIINELISNSLKHAFLPGQKGLIKISFNKNSENDFTLSVANDGKKLPDDFDINKLNSLGMLLVKSLTNQIHGKLYINSTEKSTEFKITFRDAI